ncbi:hypothetical protein FRC01_008465 [Tulasnella sp. 417]|nr:hypothetical protein FRC01_008465 [Tulasnella sp. 417]
MSELPTSRSQNTKRKRPTNNVAYLPWNVQEKIKRRRVEEMKMRSSYVKQKKKAVGTGANAGVLDSGWPRKPKTVEGVEGGDDSISKLEGGEAMALDADRRPLELSLPAPKPKKERKRSIEPSRLSSARDASIPKLQGPQEMSTKSEPKSDQVLGTDPPRDLDKGEGPNFRELKRTAYSRASLHTYKSRSLKDKPRPTSTQDGSARIGGRKGQPNMKLRMGVMLEQIRRTTGR